jgi:microcystin degradation protein MlrC
MKRIAVAGFQHETNTFSPTLATFPEFEKADAWPGLVCGNEVFTAMSGVHTSLSGFLDAASTAGRYEVVPILWCAAEPCSYVTSDAFERIAGMLCDGIRNAVDLDGVYLELHGAMVTEKYEDGEGELLRRLRDLLAPNIPIAVSLDLHANITPEMVEYASSIDLFRTYPHIDLVETGENAFKSLNHLISYGPMAKAFRQISYLVPLTSQHTGSEPCKSLYAGLDRLNVKEMHSAGIAMGFPPADIYHAGPSVVAYAGSQELADTAVEVLYQAFLDAEKVFENNLLPADAAVAEAMADTGPLPVILADAQDNSGAGATSDTTGLLTALVKGNAQGAVLALLNDPETAALAHERGVGSEFSIALGGKSGIEDQPSYNGRFRVEAVSNGEFPFTGTMFGGFTASLGPMAVLRVLDTSADVRVVIGSIRCQCLDRAIFTHIGIDLSRQRIVAVKSSVHFRADFEPIAGRIIVVAAPGSHPCQLDRITYRNLRPGVRLGPSGRPHT